MGDDSCEARLISAVSQFFRRLERSRCYLYINSMLILFILNMVSSPVVIAAAVQHTATIIFLHGLGDTGHGWSHELELIREPYMKIICPTANYTEITRHNCAVMPAWFDVREVDSTSGEDVQGIKRAATYVHNLIENEISEGIPSERIMVGGFSQGGGLALYSSLIYPRKLAGIVALSSCRLPLRETFSPSMVTGNKDIPILQCHGDQDDVVRYDYANLTVTILKQLSKNVDFKTYVGLTHSTSDEEMDDVKNFMKIHLPVV